MSKLGNVRPKDVIRGLEKKGFVVVKTRSSHVDLRHSGGKRTTISLHSKTLGKGLLHKILRQADVSIEELRQLMK